MYSADKLFVVHCDNCLDDSSVDGGDVDGQEGSEDEEDCEDGNIKDFYALPGWDDNFEEFSHSLKEYGVDISFALQYYAWLFPEYFL